LKGDLLGSLHSRLYLVELSGVEPAKVSCKEASLPATIELSPSG
jgi:hypothetical protein